MEESYLIAQVSAKLEDIAKYPKLDSSTRAKLWDKFRLEFNYNSNHMEGSTLTYGETQLLLFFDQTGGDKEFRHYTEMKAHDAAFEMVRQCAQDVNHHLTESFIRELNEIILVEPYFKNAITPDGEDTTKLITPGAYKSSPNSVRIANGQIHHYPEPNEVSPLMDKLIEWYKLETSKEHFDIVEVAAILHYKLVAIHPFDDGNGRVARLLMNYVLLKNNLPPVIIKSEDKAKYLSTLYKADTGVYQNLIDFIAENLIWSLDITIKAIKGLDLEEEIDWIKELKLIKEQNEPIAIEKRYNIETLNELYVNTITPLFEAISLKLNPLKEQFIETETNYIVNNNNLYMYHSMNDLDLRVLENVLEVDPFDSSVQTKTDSPVKSITQNFQFNDFKFGGINKVFSIMQSINVYFKDYKYEIYLNQHNEYFIEKSYGKTLLDFEINNIINQIGKSAVVEIKKQLS